MPKSTQQLQTIRTEGALLPPDILQRIASLKVDGVRPADYHLPEGFRINDAITQSWDILKKHWKNFQETRERLPESEHGTSLTNERWLLPLFKELEYGRLSTSPSPQIEDRSYPIERFYNHTPIHLIGCNLPMDRRTKGARGAATSSPHSMMQEFLNRSNQHQWGFLSNGRQLRILRDNVSLSRQAYVEFDLEGMMGGEVYGDFVLLWLLCHQSRVESERTDDCWLEKWSKLAREEGTRVLKNLRTGVTRAIELLGQGFIAHPHNDELRSKLQESGTLTKDDFYRQLLRIVYRLLFLFVAEDRQLLHPPNADEKACELYDTYYSTRRLREMAFKLRGSKHSDLWHSLSLIFHGLHRHNGLSELGLPALGSFLWDPQKTADLLGPAQIVSAIPSASDKGEKARVTGPSELQNSVLISNDDLLAAIRILAYVEQDRVLRDIDYRNLGTEEFGSVYESLLELHPTVHIEAKSFDLGTASGNERKTSGSYYTEDSLVQCLLDSALDPVIAERLKGLKGKDAEDAILNIKVCDPACGSGHFLIGAARRLAHHLARIRTGESEPSPEDYQHALRDVISRCIYGVDINPMSVELCKVALWMEAMEPGKPLSFLDHHIQCGNSLLGTTPRLLSDGIPDDALSPIEGDVKAVVNSLKAQNKKERQEYKKGQGYLFEPFIKLGNLPSEFSKLSRSSDDSVADVAEKERRYAELVSGADYLNARLLADTWCAAFVWIKDNSDLGKMCPTERDFRKIENSPYSILPHVKSEVQRLSDQYQFFHWHLAFPDVFRLPAAEEKAENESTGWSTGFDVLIGNPPWELVAADQGQEATRRFAGEQQLFKANDYAILNGRRDLYKLFFVRGPLITRAIGRVSFLMPFGVFVEDDSAEIRRWLFDRGSVTEIRHFQNHQKRFFEHVHASYRFCEFTFTHARGLPHRFSNVARLPAEISSQAFFEVDRAQFDTELSTARSAILYPEERYGVLHRNISQQLSKRSNGDFRVVAEFHSSTDKALVRSERGCDSDWVLLKNRNIHQFDPTFAPPEAFVARADVIARLERKELPADRWLDRNPRLIFRDIARNDDERTLIATLAPPGYLSTYDTPMAVPLSEESITQTSELLFFGGAFNSYLFDFLLRPYVDKHIKGYTLNRVPWPTGDAVVESPLVQAAKRIVLELSYTAWDLEAFAFDCGYSGPPFRRDEERRFLLRCELDAAYFHLYLRPPAEWGADSPQLREMFPTPRLAVDYIMESFPIVQRKDIKRTEILNDKGEVATEGTYGSSQK